MRNRQTGFTLVELLVVVTIIVVLLALLTPALDKAIYQAELAVCGARLKAMATGVSLYAFDHKREYPHRNVGGPQSGQPSRLSLDSSTSSAGAGQYEDRRMLVGYIAYENYLDPFCEKIDIEGSRYETNVFANYSLWFGFAYTTAGMKGMYRMGDRVEWVPKNQGANPPTYRFDFLATDVDAIRRDAPYAYSSHPDTEGLLVSAVLQDQASSGVNVNVFGVNPLLTSSFWVNGKYDAQGRLRGPSDFNYARQDGSVARYGAVRWNDWEDGQRMAIVPEGGSYINELPDWNQLPKN